jgi:hypothetical protein
MKISKSLGGALWLAAAGMGCSEGASSAEGLGSVEQAAVTYKPTLCAKWEAKSGSGASIVNCYEGKDVAAVYKLGTSSVPKDTTFAAITIQAPPVDQPAAIKQFFDQTRAVSAYFKSANALADVVRNTANELRTQCDTIRDAQRSGKEKRDGAIDDIIDGLEGRVLAQLEGPKKEEQGKLATFRKKRDKVEPVIERARDRLTAIGAELKPLVTRHKEYLATEKPVFKKLEGIAARGSTAGLDTLFVIQEELLALERDESPKCDQFEIDVRRLQARVGYVVDDYVFELGDSKAFLRELKLEKMIPNAADALQDSLAKIGSYCDARRPKFDQAFASILDGIKRRNEALIVASATAATQKTLNDARFLRASSDFLKTSSARSARLAKLPISSQRLKLPFLFAKYQEHEATLALEPMCTESGLAAVSFMDAGCEIIKRDISKSRNYIGISVPAIIKAALPRLKTAGVNAAFVDGISADLTAKRFRKAASDYDMAVSLSDKAVTP